jgi:hypothetical protein
LRPGVGSGERLIVRRFQVPGEELGDPVDRMFAVAHEYLAHKRFEIVAIELRAAQQAVKRCRALAAGIATGERKFLRPSATQRNARSAALLSISMRPSSQ